MSRDTLLRQYKEREEEMQKMRHESVPADYIPQFVKPVQAMKEDGGKRQWDLLPFDVLEEVVKALEYGAVKYSPQDWRKGLPWSKRFNPALRHMFAWWRGEGKDKETELSHLALAICNLLFLLHHEQMRLEHFDDRPHLEKRYVLPNASQSHQPH